VIETTGKRPLALTTATGLEVLPGNSCQATRQFPGAVKNTPADTVDAQPVDQHRCGRSRNGGAVCRIGSKVAFGSPVDFEKANAPIWLERVLQRG
jgi:hypothetical protein